MPRGDLTLCNRFGAADTIILWMGGGSNCRGNNAETGDPATLGYSMPANVTVYEDGVVPAATYATTHFGPEVGCADELVSVYGVTQDIVFVKHGVPGSSLAAWNSTYAGELTGYYATTGAARAGIFVHGANDAAGAGAATYEADLLTLASLVRRVSGAGAGCGITIVGLKTMDPVTYPNEAVVLAAQRAFVVGGQGYRFLDASDLTQSDPDSHYTAASQITLGRRWARQLVADGIITPP